ncbi:uncharacterized protein ACN2A1_007860 isoform 2-T2 [Glossina fuscipes fuscipes]
MDLLTTFYFVFFFTFIRKQQQYQQNKFLGDQAFNNTINGLVLASSIAWPGPLFPQQQQQQQQQQH